MGQTIGKIPSGGPYKAEVKLDSIAADGAVVTSIAPLYNLPKSIVINLRCAVAEVSENGYSLTSQELEQELILHEYFTDEKICEYSNALFNIFNAGSEGNEIDSFELIGTICLTSGMTIDEKVDFMFDFFDLNEKERLCINEVTLAFRSLVSGARKIKDNVAAANEDIDQIALEVFDLVLPDSLKYSLAMADDQTLTKQQFRAYVLNCPEVVAFVTCYEDIVIERSANLVDDTRANVSSLLRVTTTGSNEREINVNSPNGPWREQQRFLLPNSNDENEGASRPPIDGLKLEHVFGQNTGTEAIYTSDGDVLFAAASLVIKLVEGTKQEFFNEHSNLVSSIDIFKMHDGMGDMVASSDINGDDCKVCVWSSYTLSSLVTFPTRHQNGASKVSFSPSGELLLTLGNNDTNSTIGVYKWRERRLLFTAKMPGLGFYDCSFLSSDNSFGVCGEECGVHFWTKSKSHDHYKYYRGATSLFPARHQMTSIVCIGDVVVTGSTSGVVWVWEGRVCVEKVATFRFPVTKLFAGSVGLFVSTLDGTIHLLDNVFNPKRRFDPFRCSNNHIIQTLCWESSQEKLLVGDSSSTFLVEIDLNSDSKSKAIMSCHSELTDFAVDTLNDIIITVGEDSFIRKWDRDTMAVLEQHNLEKGLSCIAYHQNSDRLAVGFSKSDDCDASGKADVAFAILSSNDLTNIIHHGHNSQKTLTVCRFSNDGELIAFGSKDSSIYIHSTEKDFPLVAKARGHSAPILTFDFGCVDDSCDSASFIRSNSINGEAFHWSTHGKKQTPLSQRHTRWESQSCIFGWYVEGAHDLFGESNSHITSCCPLSDESIVVGDSQGGLRVFSNPVLSNESIYLQYTRHVGKVQKIALCGDTLYTLGEDSCLCKWKVSGLSWPAKMPPSFDNHLVIEEKKEEKHWSMSLATQQLEDLDFSLSQQNITPNTLVHKPLQPWMRSIVPPSSYTPQLGPLPDGRLVLEKIHGYNGHSAKQNLHYLSSGEGIVYSVGRMLVRYDEEGNMQQFCGVEGKINCLAVHQERSLCAIGQTHNAEQSITIVDLNTMSYNSMFKGTAKDIDCLDFHQTGRYLLSLSGNRISILDLDNECMIVASTLTHTAETLDVRFAAKPNTFVEVGKNFVRFWYVKGSDMQFEEVDMSTMEIPTTFFTCIGWIGNDLIVGASTGDVIRFAGNTPIHKIKAYPSQITNISSTTDNRVAISAEKIIKLYDSKLRCSLVIDTEVLGVRHQISSLSWHAETRKIIIGTEGNEVWEISSNDGSNINEGPLVRAHASQPNAICANPNGTTFATVADDGFLRLWGDESNSFDLNMPSRACAYSPDGRMLAVGFGKPKKDTAKTVNGKWVVIDVSDGSTYRIIAERRDSRNFIREMKWFGGSDRLAVGSDNKIYVYQMSSQTDPAVTITISLVSTIDITSPAIHFDYSKDGKYLRVNTEAKELMWFEADPAIRIEEASLMKDVEWESENCVFTWNCQGTHQDESSVRALDCYIEAEGCGMVVAGGDDGVLRVHTYPCTSTRSNYLPYNAHVGAITCVRMLRGVSHVVSTGDDHAIMIWRHEHEFDEDFGCQVPNVQEDSTVIDDNDVTDMCRKAFFDTDDHIILPTSGVCLVLNAKRTTKNEFQRHSSQIGAIATSTSRHLIASGDGCTDFPSTIWIWDPKTCADVAALSDSRLRGVSALTFSLDDKMLLCVSSDENHRIFVWSTINGNWNDAYLSTYSLGGHDKISFVQFTQSHLITGGGNGLNFWSFVPSLSVSRANLSMTQCQGETLTCSAMMGGDELVTGTSGGNFVTWSVTGKKIVNEFKAHNSSVTSLCACPEGIVSASSDGLITIWSRDTQKIQVHQTTSRSAIHSLDVRPHSNGLSTMKILALSDSECFEISCVTGRVIYRAEIPSAVGELSSN